MLLIFHGWLVVTLFWIQLHSHQKQIDLLASYWICQVHPIVCPDHWQYPLSTGELLLIHLFSCLLFFSALLNFHIILDIVSIFLGLYCSKQFSLFLFPDNVNTLIGHQRSLLKEEQAFDSKLGVLNIIKENNSNCQDKCVFMQLLQCCKKDQIQKLGGYN